MESSKSYFGGIPTGPDVDALMRKFGIPGVGTKISYQELADAIGAALDSSRLHTVIVAWRKRIVREGNRDSRAVRGSGIEFLDESTRLSERVKDYDGTIRRTRRLYVETGLIESQHLSEIERKQSDVIRRRASAMLEDGINGKREVAQLRPTEQNPRKQIGKA